MRLLRAYNALLSKHPIKTMTVATGVLMTTGDAVAQLLVEQRPTWDVSRTAKFALIGASLFGPAWTVWYRYLDVAVPKVVAAKKLQGLAKAVVDQSLFAPSLLLVFLFLLDVPDKGANPGKFWAKTKDEFADVMKNYYKIWPAVQLANFYLVPLRHRVMVINFVALFWNTFLAWKANCGQQQQQQPADKTVKEAVA